MSVATVVELNVRVNSLEETGLLPRWARASSNDIKLKAGGKTLSDQPGMVPTAWEVAALGWNVLPCTAIGDEIAFI